ncbi:MAG: glutamate-1-semialdehyde 2,1-aminomutase [Candidatus Thermoplasmatota archaeon]|nr:glutamate-1-semialdehyde 2,1-aminomutase [Candidatus Thermoplasmatota archaeon]
MPTQAVYEKEYVRKTKKSREHFMKAKKLLPAGVESNVRFFEPYPFYVKRAKGAYIYDLDDNRIIDYALGYGPMLLGHNHPEVVRAVKEQVGKGTMYGASPDLAIEYVKMVQKAMPSVEMFRFANSGTEATMHPMRVARSYTGKEKIAKAEGAYHGGHDYALQGVDIPEAMMKDSRNQPTVPFGSGIPKCISDLVVLYPFNDWGATEDVITKNADDLAAVIIEPIQAGGGCFIPRDNYLKKLRKLTTELGIVLIFDEVLTGFRVAFGGVQEKFDVKPDITCIAKVAGGGYQLAGFGGKRDIMEEIVPKVDGNVYHGGTYNAHPVSVAGGLRTLQILSKPGIYKKIDKIGDSLFHGLKEVAEDRGVNVWVESLGSLGQMYFTDKEVSRWRDAIDVDREKWRHWFMHSLGRGVFFGVPHADEHFFTSLAHSEKDIAYSLEVSDEAFKAIAKG